MFEPTGWFAIDQGNARVRGVVVSTLESGLELIGQGSVATLVGRLRSGLRVVDVDLEGERGHGAAEQLAAWCRGEGLWHLVRPSGGAEGRTHIFVAPAQRSQELESLLAHLRTSYNTSTKNLDLRRHVRPLTAPHRLGGHTRPYGPLSAATRDLRARMSPSSVSPAGGAKRTPSTSQRRPPRQHPNVVAFTPKPRRRTELPPPWELYLRSAVTPNIGGHDHSRSTVEAIATGHLLRAGYDAESAWATVLTSHPLAMTRAKASKRRWIAWVWNRAVEEDRAHSPTRRVDPTVAAAVAAARERLGELIWTQAPRRRPALLLVGHHVLDRMERNDSRRVPVPERDLALDTGISDRKTIRNALRALHGVLGLLDVGAWDPAKRAASSFEFEIAEAPEIEGVRQIPPPSSHTPSARGLWHSLPRASHSLWRALQVAGEPASVAVLAQGSGLTTARDTVPTTGQLRTATAALTALARAGLADCTADGRWLPRKNLTVEQVEEGARLHAAHESSIVAERAEYRAAASEWLAERGRAYGAQQARERAWWVRLEARERLKRRAEWSARFDGLSVHEQEITKATLARRRLAAGLDEAGRHDAWVTELSREEYLARSIERQHRFEQLAPPLQQANAAAWERHRNRFGIGRSTAPATIRREHSELLPHGVAVRDRSFVDQQLTLVTEESSGAAETA
ncbi:MAG: hypothetical protein WKF79_01615 [Nocardioides sp.]